jgi:hypothetical protein
LEKATVSSYTSIIKFLSADGESWHVEFFDDQPEYFSILKLKENVYLLVGKEYSQGGQGQAYYTFSAVEIVNNRIKPYNAFNGKSCMSVFTDGLTHGDPPYSLYGPYGILDRVIDDIHIENKPSPKIEITKLIINDNVKARAKEYGSYYLLRSNEYEVNTTTFLFNGESFTGSYENLLSAGDISIYNKYYNGVETYETFRFTVDDE